MSKSKKTRGQLTEVDEDIAKEEDEDLEVKAQTGVRWNADDRAILKELRRIYRREGRGKMVDVLRSAIWYLADSYGCLPNHLQDKEPT